MSRRVASAIAMGVAIAIGCATAPPARVVPSWERGSLGLHIGERERVLWQEADAILAELEAADAIVSDASLDALIADVLQAIAPALDDRAPALRARAIWSSERNASALPNGVLLLSSGLLAALENEAQLAAMLGHEVAHVVHRHGLVAREYEEITPSTVYRMELAREQEWEADLYALELMEMAGYPSAEMQRVLGLLDSDPRPRRDRVLAWESHPDLATRWKHVAAIVEGKGVGARRSGADRYAEAITGILLPTAELEIEAGEYVRAFRAIDRYLERFPQSGRAFYLKAEALRRTMPEGRKSLVARKAYERAVLLAPDDPDALRALGLLLREVGETQRSRELLDRYLRVAPDAVDRRLIERYLEGG